LQTCISTFSFLLLLLFLYTVQHLNQRKYLAKGKPFSSHGIYLWDLSPDWRTYLVQKWGFYGKQARQANQRCGADSASATGNHITPQINVNKLGLRSNLLANKQQQQQQQQKKKKKQA